VVDWVDVFTRKELYDDILSSLSYCQKHKGLSIYAWCLMPGHLQVVVPVAPGPNTLSDENPVVAGIVYRAEDYVLSSAAQYAGQ